MTRSLADIVVNDFQPSSVIGEKLTIVMVNLGFKISKWSVWEYWGTSKMERAFPSVYFIHKQTNDKTKRLEYNFHRWCAHTVLVRRRRHYSLCVVQQEVTFSTYREKCERSHSQGSFYITRYAPYFYFIFLSLFYPVILRPNVLWHEARVS